MGDHRLTRSEASRVAALRKQAHHETEMSSQHAREAQRLEQKAEKIIAASEARARHAALGSVTEGEK